MTEKEFKKNWNDYLHNDLRIVHGYKRDNITYTQIISYTKMSPDIYLKLQGGGCLTVRSIKSITIIE